MHRNRSDAKCRVVRRHRKVARCRPGITVEALAESKRQLVAFYLRVGEPRWETVDLLTRDIGARRVRQVGVDGGTVFKDVDVAVVQLQAVFVNGRAVLVLVGSGYLVLEQ